MLKRHLRLPNFRAAGETSTGIKRISGKDNTLTRRSSVATDKDGRDCTAVKNSGGGLSQARPVIEVPRLSVCHSLFPLGSLVNPRSSHGPPVVRFSRRNVCAARQEEYGRGGSLRHLVAQDTPASSVSYVLHENQKRHHGRPLRAILAPLPPAVNSSFGCKCVSCRHKQLRGLSPSFSSHHGLR